MTAQDDNSSCNGNFYDPALSEIIGMNEEIIKIKKKILELGGNGSTVLIEGESGTGKELVARAIHNCSPRKNKLFIAINCGGFAETLLESELFGHKKGAFTGAESDKPGKFAIAEGGTLFLDEICSMSTKMQSDLLRVVEDRTYYPLGSSIIQKADVRIITATNKNLNALIESREFKDDLFYRIDQARITLPPLRARKDDIPLLARHIINKINQVEGKEITSISDETVLLLKEYDFPGNVRELENIIRKAFIYRARGIIQKEDLPEEFLSRINVKVLYARNHLQENEAKMIVDTLKKNNWKKLETAHELEISKSKLWRKMKKYGIPFKEQGSMNSYQ